MISINYIVCKKEIKIQEIKVGEIANCKCGCSQRCTTIYKDNVSGWRVINPLEMQKIRLGVIS